MILVVRCRQCRDEGPIVTQFIARSGIDCKRHDISRGKNLHSSSHNTGYGSPQQRKWHKEIKKVGSSAGFLQAKLLIYSQDAELTEPYSTWRVHGQPTSCEGICKNHPVHVTPEHVLPWAGDLLSQHGSTVQTPAKLDVYFCSRKNSNLDLCNKLGKKQAKSTDKHRACA